MPIISYGVDLFEVSDSTMSMPPFLTVARTALDDPISTPIANQSGGGSLPMAAPVSIDSQKSLFKINQSI